MNKAVSANALFFEGEKLSWRLLSRPGFSSKIAETFKVNSPGWGYRSVFRRKKG